MKNIIVLVTEIAYSHIRKTLSGIWRCCLENDCNLFVCSCERRYDPTDAHDNGEYMIYQIPDFADFDGVIVVNSTIFNIPMLMEAADRIRKSGIPASSLEREAEGFLNFAIDNRTAVKKVVLHLIREHGYKRIDFITGLSHSFEAEERFCGYKEALLEAGIPFENDRVFIGNYLKGSGENAAKSILASPLPLPQAIVCANDTMAIGVCQVLRDNGINIPEQIAVTGFDDDYETSFHIPSISTVSRDQDKQGYLACQALLDGSARSMAGQTVSIEATPVYRRSCGCVPEQSAAGNDEFRLNYFDTRNMDERFNRLTRTMAIALTSVETFTQLKQVIRDFIPAMDCEAFSLFLFNSVLEDDGHGMYETDASADAAFDRSAPCTMLIAYDKGIFSEDEPCDLHTITKRSSRNTQGVYNVLSPIHFGQRFFGYCMISNSRFSRESVFYYSWIMNIANAIENVRKQKLLRVMIDKLNGMWCHDSLTDLYNRIGFKKYGGRIWDESIRQKKNILLLFIDLDGLKHINDTYGHDEGDRCIRALSSILKSEHHHSEAIMRYGGDEFVIIASGVTESFADGYIAALQKDIEEYNLQNPAPYQLAASIGKCILTPTQDDSLDDAIDRADQQMYEIKKARKK